VEYEFMMAGGEEALAKGFEQLQPLAVDNFF
jgi:hypothetical protein